MTRFSVDLDELDRVVASLEAFGTTLATKLADLQKVVETVQDGWQGDAAEAQLVAHARIAQGAGEVHGAVLELHQAARHAHQSYAAAVQANQSTWKQLR